MNNSDATIATYDKYAKVYDAEVAEFWDGFPKEFIDRFIAELPHKKVLDLGSGSGRDALLLRERGANVLCVDASKEMVAITQELGFESVMSTFANYDYPNRHFGGAWAYTSLIHIPKDEAEKIIRAIYATLKTGGVFAIGVIEGDSAEMVERDTMPNCSRYFKKYRRNELRDLVESCDFSLLYEQDYQPKNSKYLNHIYRKDDKTD